ncbi:ABC transporter ATP-binding protein [Roseibium aestuarii]|uniref:ABC transporter ATP-binding protein n=1 Tax=Roseibium aestuarii TaxID=2600299 RepID=A0ABW4JWK4_9HYPH|nr:sn-glycerol-3-phosphate ABC transporter ATP-binding protein UgpC [Roseibium aestuarii]
MEPSISIRNLSLDFGSLRVLKDLDLNVGQGEFLVLLGSSGCGKSTLLNCIAGLLEISEGQIFIGGRNVTWEEPSQRGIGMVFQSYALYPQMTVAGNLSFGLKNAGLPKAEIAARVDRAAKILQIEPLLDRKPAALSGGQRQRAAIGRALVRDADVFLFDEPLSNLDAKLRADLRVEIKQLHSKLKNTMIYVTHDQIEAMTLADRIAIMRGGSILQLDTPEEIYLRPNCRYVANFIGSPSMNFFDGRIEGGDHLRFVSGSLNLPLAGYAFADPQGARPGPATLGIRPEHIVSGAEAEAAAISLTAEVDLIEPLGSDTFARVTLDGSNLWIRLDGQARTRPGDRLVIGFAPERAHLFDLDTELRL